MSGYYLSVTVHVFAAILWLGGMFFLAVVGAPVLRTVEPPELRRELFRRLGERFRAAGWAAIGVLGVLLIGFLFMNMLSGGGEGSGLDGSGRRAHLRRARPRVRLARRVTTVYATTLPVLALCAANLLLIAALGGSSG